MPKSIASTMIIFVQRHVFFPLKNVLENDALNLNIISTVVHTFEFIYT